MAYQANCRKNRWLKTGECKREYVLLAEQAFGGILPDKAVVHHHNDQQLVICQDQSYHMLIHARTRALRECGNPDYRKCVYCHQYDSPENMKYYACSRHFVHKVCRSIKDKERWRKIQDAKKHEGLQVRTEA